MALANDPGTICWSLDFDAVSTWVAAGATGMRTLSRGEFAADSIPRILDLFDAYGVRSTWFIPGVSALQYRSLVQEVATRGHEIASHGLRHEDVSGFSYAEIISSLRRTNDILSDITGRMPSGARIPGRDIGDGSCLRALEELGMLYDSSLVGGYRCYRAPSARSVDGDHVVHWEYGLSLVEVPFAWILTDFSQFEYHYGSPEYRAVVPNARQLEEIWRDEIDELPRRISGGMLMFTLHPQVIGMNSRLAMVERVIRYARSAGLAMRCAYELADDFVRGEVE